MKCQLNRQRYEDCRVHEDVHDFLVGKDVTLQEFACLLDMLKCDTSNSPTSDGAKTAYPRVRANSTHVKHKTRVVVQLDQLICKNI